MPNLQRVISGYSLNKCPFGYLTRESRYASFYQFLAKPNAAIYYVHGGVHQGLDFSKRYLREMAKATGATVIAPDYRRAPEHQFPGPFDDCLAGNKSKFTHVFDDRIIFQTVLPY